MQALVWHGTDDVEVDSVPDPVLVVSTDAIVRITSTAICGSDLHLLDKYRRPLYRKHASGLIPKSVDRIAVRRRRCRQRSWSKQTAWAFAATSAPTACVGRIRLTAEPIVPILAFVRVAGWRRCWRVEGAGHATGSSVAGGASRRPDTPPPKSPCPAVPLPLGAPSCAPPLPPYLPTDRSGRLPSLGDSPASRFCSSLVRAPTRRPQPNSRRLLPPSSAKPPLARRCYRQTPRP